jgi:hypothetical protein
MPDPCRILYNVKSQKHIDHIQELIKDQMKKTFNCPISNVVFGNEHRQLTFIGFEYTVNIEIEDSALKSVFTTAEEAYSARIEVKETLIKAKTYVGFVRGL